ncbi:Methionyl-tRNA formyltransferase [Flavobacterium columnare]|uniref:methionyl-tRNA formyltransferase n=2 Tax=Flavobacterium TaxID=237 RepID=A0ABW8PN54_9FLAO|nr:formyltransferase family protein [Flavobacterium columnare]SPE76864.1 Methionyl-tRNA formyltransferase [Flavobacterium columnare]
MRIVFFGEDSFSLIVLQSLIREGHEVAGVFCPNYDNSIYIRLEKFCNSNNIIFYRLENFRDDNFLNLIRVINPDLVVVCHFQKLFSKDLIIIPKFGCINLHPSLLPFYRGMSPQHWPIINGDVRTGITVHFIDEGVDTGDIILQEQIDIDGKDTVYDLQNKMKYYYNTIVVDAIKKISENSEYIVQKKMKGSYYGRLKISDCQILESFTVTMAYNLIRGVTYPYFGARFRDFIIWKAEIFTFGSYEVSLDLEEKKLYLKDGVLKLLKFEKL